MKYKIFLLGLLTCCLLTLGCGNGDNNNAGSENTADASPKLTNADILGRWNIVQAARNNRPTETLEGAFFDFKSGDRMLTNLLGEEQEMGYKLIKDVIHQEGSQQLKYKVEKHSGRQMTLSMTMSGFDFLFDLEKAE